MSSMTIGELAARSRLSTKALRLYDRLGLLEPARVDPATGYRIYAEGQVADARLIALLRRIDMPLGTIREVITADDPNAAAIVADYWAGVGARHTERGALVAYLQARLTGATLTMYEINTRTIPTREVLSYNQHVHLADTPAFFETAFTRLRATGPGLGGIEGLPYLVYYGEVSDDGDGPIELCRPIASHVEVVADARLQRRTEAVHDEVYIRLTKRQLGWPAMLPAVDALDAWIADHARQPVGPLRQVLIADQRSASPDSPVCDLTVPLRTPPAATASTG